MSKVKPGFVVAALAALAVAGAASVLAGCTVPATSGLTVVHVQGATHPIEPDCQCSGD